MPSSRESLICQAVVITTQICWLFFNCHMSCSRGRSVTSRSQQNIYFHRWGEFSLSDLTQFLSLIKPFRKQTLNNGLIAIVDAQKCSWRLARDQMKLITQILDKNLINLFAIRTEAFSMQNCAKTYKKGEVRDLTFPEFLSKQIRFECYALGFAVVTG